MSNRGGGGDLSLALHHVTNGYTSLSRRSTVPTPNRETSSGRTPNPLSPYITIKRFQYVPDPLPVSPLVATIYLRTYPTDEGGGVRLPDLAISCLPTCHLQSGKIIGKRCLPREVSKKKTYANGSAASIDIAVVQIALPGVLPQSRKK